MEHDQHPTNSEINDEEIKSTVETKKEPKKFSFPVLFTGMLGGFIAAIVTIILLTNNIIPFANQGDINNPDTIKENKHEDVISTMATEDANTASNMQEASDAVVGVLNLQQSSIWSESEEAGTGSGIIYKKKDGKAYIVTNHHVVDGAKEVEIALNNDERIKAKVLGSDELSDLAVLQVDGSKINTVANLGASEQVKVGDTVFAIGNPLGMEFANSLTKGIISGLNRSVSIDTNGDSQPDWVTEVIQTDAAINPGNSGGALVNEKGKVIGINSMKIARQEVEGIGFAIPIDTAIPIIDQLETSGTVSRPFIGISVASLNQVPPQYRNNVQLPEEVEAGIVVANVESGSPADKAGLMQFDVITKINGQQIDSLLELRKFMYSETQVGDTVKMEVYRNGKKQTMQLKLTESEN